MLATKQIGVNLLGDRHRMAVVVQSVLLLYMVVALGVVLIERKSPSFARPILTVQVMLLLWWSIIVVIGPGGDPGQRFVSLGYDALYTALIWVPVVLIRTQSSLARAELALLYCFAFIASFGIIQWLFGDQTLPALVHSDATVALSGTAFGTTRVNGLIGTSIDFGLVMTFALLYAYVRLSTRISLPVVVLVVMAAFEVLLSGSRAAWLTAAGAILLSTRIQRLPLLVLVGAAVLGATLLLLPQGYLTAPLDRPELYYGSDSLRVTGIQDVLASIRDSPIVGTGIGFQNGPAFGTATTQKVITDGYWWAVVLEGGVVGFALVAAFLASCAGQFVRQLRGGGNAYAKVALLMLVVAFIGGFINSALVNQSTNAGFYLLLGLCLAAIRIKAEAAG